MSIAAATNLARNSILIVEHFYGKFYVLQKMSDLKLIKVNAISNSVLGSSFYPDTVHFQCCILNVEQVAQLSQRNERSSGFAFMRYINP